MKYTIEGFSQEYAMTLKKHIQKRGKDVEIKVDCTDLVILRWFVDFYPKMKKIVVDGKEFAWLTHKKLIDDLPLIDISRNAFIERMQKLVEFGILDYKFIKDGGTFSLYSFGRNYEYLINKGVCSNIYGVDAQAYTGVDAQPNTKDNTITNELNNYKYIVAFLNSRTGSNYKYTTPKTQSLIRARLKEGFTLEDFEKVICKMTRKWKGTEWEQYLRPETLFGTKFEGYLNDKMLKQERYSSRNFDDVNNIEI